MTPADRDYLRRCAAKDVLVLNASATFKRLERRGLVRAEWRDIGLRGEVLCAVLTPAGKDAITHDPR